MSKVCHLKKAIYELKQSLRAWFEKFSEVVLGNGFRPYADHFVFIKQSNRVCVMLVVYVDNILLMSGDVG